MAKLICITLLFLVIPRLVSGVTIIDPADNYASWINGSNGGSGLGNWNFTSNNDGLTLFAGFFLGDSTAGAGDLNTSSNSFGIYANPGGAFALANRSFINPLNTNDLFSVQLGVNFDNGNKGLNVKTGGASVFSFNVGSGATVSSSFTDNPAITSYDYGGSDAVIDISLQVTSGSTLDYSVSRTSSLGIQGVLFSGTISGISGSIDELEFYNSGTDDGSAQNNLYFNNIAVTAIPEPSTYAAIFGLMVVGLATYRHRKKASARI